MGSNLNSWEFFVLSNKLMILLLVNLPLKKTKFSTTTTKFLDEISNFGLEFNFIKNCY